jgi:hypothetical protein
MVNSEKSELRGEHGTELELLDSGLGPARPLSEREVAALSDRLTRDIGVVRLRSRRRPVARLLLIGAATTTAAAAAAMYGTEWLAPRAPEAAPREVTGNPIPAPPPTAPAAEPVPNHDGRPTEESPPAPLERPDRDLRSVARHSRAAEDHLAKANSLRGEHRYREALDLYLHVAQQFPRSRQARAAELAAAAIRLEQFRDIDGAEYLYRSVRDAPGELSAEAEFGLAEVARARGDRAGELRTLREFLAHHAGHPLEAAAERRMKALASP